MAHPLKAGKFTFVDFRLDQALYQAPSGNKAEMNYSTTIAKSSSAPNDGKIYNSLFLFIPVGSINESKQES